jgi:D-alanyl-D-alanine carboxypeptidase
MLPSGNDAAMAIALHCGGYESFIEQMNEAAKN